MFFFFFFFPVKNFSPLSIKFLQFPFPFILFFFTFVFLFTYTLSRRRLRRDRTPSFYYFPSENCRYGTEIALNRQHEMHHEQRRITPIKVARSYCYPIKFRNWEITWTGTDMRLACVDDFSHSSLRFYIATATCVDSPRSCSEEGIVVSPEVAIIQRYARRRNRKK